MEMFGLRSRNRTSPFDNSTATVNGVSIKSEWLSRRRVGATCLIRRWQGASNRGKKGCGAGFN